MDQHCHQVAGEDDPEQHVAELRATLNIRCEVTGVHIRDAGNKGGTKKRKEPLDGALPRLARQHLARGTEGPGIASAYTAGFDRIQPHLSHPPRAFCAQRYL